MQAYIKDVKEGEGFSLWVPFKQTSELILKNVKACDVEILDGREVSKIQRRHIYALIRDVSQWSGYSPEEAKENLKYLFLEMDGDPWFSLADCTMSQAKDFLQYLIEFIVRHNIPSRIKLYEIAPDMAKFVYHHLASKKCVLCGKPADLHHVDHVGLARDRTEIIHEGMRVLPLCREHHTQAHSMGKETFLKRYHVEPLELNYYMCKLYGLKGAGDGDN